MQSSILADVTPRKQGLIKKPFTKKRGGEAQEVWKNKAILRVSDIGVT